MEKMVQSLVQGSNQIVSVIRRGGEETAVIREATAEESNNVRAVNHLVASDVSSILMLVEQRR